MITQLTDQAKFLGRKALISVFDSEYQEGDTQLRSYENEDAETLAKTLAKAKNLDQLRGIWIGIIDSHEAFFPEQTERNILVAKATSAYINAASEELRRSNSSQHGRS
jgi:hypothetical protein